MMNLMLTMIMKRLSEKRKNSEYASGRDDGLAEGKKAWVYLREQIKKKLAIAKIMLQGKESLDKIMKYTGLSKKELTMLL